MIIIAGYDCALKNLGICFIYYDDEWVDKLEKLISIIKTDYKNINYNDEKSISNIVTIFEKINNILDNVIKIIFFNVIDLVPNNTIEEVNIIDRTKRLKYLLNCLDLELPKPDIVLIEYQMKQNDISRCISHQIAYHYMDICDNIIFEKKSEQSNKKNIKKKKVRKKIPISGNNIMYYIDDYPIKKYNEDLYDKKSITKNNIVEVVGTSLKNSVSFSKKGEYCNFILKYSNYVANKKHTDWNFKYFMEVFGGVDSDFFININKKTDDISDAFMMIFSWLVKKNML